MLTTRSKQPSLYWQTKFAPSATANQSLDGSMKSQFATAFNSDNDVFGCEKPALPMRICWMRQSRGKTIAQTQETNIILAEIDRLPAKYREVIVLRCVDEHSRRDTANLLNQTEAKVKGLLSRGRNMLKQRLIRRGIAPIIALSVSHAETCLGAATSVQPTLLETTLSVFKVPLNQLVTAKSSTGAASSISIASITSAKACLKQMTAATFMRAASLAACLLCCLALPIAVIAQGNWRPKLNTT